ncbi:MAG: flagellar basal body-associated protein FliL [Lachnospiraceae bacterium]|nr:flagellar basal body-associated protein FliL [Lachnospiraceae bacterium]
MKKNLISIIILALLIVNIVLTAIMMVSVLGTNKKTADLVTDIASAISLDLGEGQESEKVEMVSMADTETYTISEMRILLKKDNAVDEEGNVIDDKDHYALISVALSMNTKNKGYKTYSDLSTREDLIKGLINEVVSQYTIGQAKDNAQQMEQEILKKIQERFDSDFIYDVTLISPLYQ